MKTLSKKLKRAERERDKERKTRIAAERYIKHLIAEAEKAKANRNFIAWILAEYMVEEGNEEIEINAGEMKERELLIKADNGKMKIRLKKTEGV